MFVRAGVGPGANNDNFLQLRNGWGLPSMGGGGGAGGGWLVQSARLAVNNIPMHKVVVSGPLQAYRTSTLRI